MRYIAVACLVLLALSGCSPTPSGPVVATVTFAGLDESDPVDITASGTVSGVAEDGGICRFTFHAPNGAASRLTSKGVAAGDHTDCGPVHESVTLLLGPGSYDTTLRYETLGGETVESEPFVMVIP